MRNDKRPEVTLGDETYTLVLTLGAMMDFEEETGKGVLDLVEKGLRIAGAASVPQEGLALVDEDAATTRGVDTISDIIKACDLNLTDIATLLWACVGGKEAGLSVREVAGGVTPSSVMEIAQGLVVAVQGAMPEDDGKGGDEVDEETGDEDPM